MFKIALSNFNDEVIIDNEYNKGELKEYFVRLNPDQQKLVKEQLSGLAFVKMQQINTWLTRIQVNSEKNNWRSDEPG